MVYNDPWVESNNTNLFDSVINGKNSWKKN